MRPRYYTNPYTHFLQEKWRNEVYRLHKKGLTFKQVGPILGISGEHASMLYRQVPQLDIA